MNTGFKIKATIMIPTYNQAQYIEQCIDSVLVQDYSNLEVIISDDSTNDETEKIVKEKYISDPRVQYFHNVPALGRVGNYHKILYERATGDYVLNLDGDDWLVDNTYISKAADILNNTDVVCVTAKVKVYIEKENNFLMRNNNRTLKPFMTGIEYLEKFANDDISMAHLTTLYRREAALEIGFYNNQIIFTDVESIFRLICQKRIAYLDEYIGVWRIHSNNTSHLYNNVDNLDELFSVEASIVDYCKDKNINDLNLKQWKLKMQLKHLYPLFSNSIKEKKLNNTYRLLKNLWSYDTQVFFHFQGYAIKKNITFIVNKMRLNK